MLRLALCSLSLLCLLPACGNPACKPASGRLVDGGEFATGTRAPALMVVNQTAGNAPEDVTLSQDHTPVHAGISYRIALWARAESQRGVLLTVRDDDADVEVANLPVERDWSQHEVVFTPEETDNKARFELQFGGVSDAAVWIDGVVFEEQD